MAFVVIFLYSFVCFSFLSFVFPFVYWEAQFLVLVEFNQQNPLSSPVFLPLPLEYCLPRQLGWRVHAEALLYVAILMSNYFFSLDTQKDRPRGGQPP